MQDFKSQILNPKYLMAVGAALVAFAVLMDLPGVPSLTRKTIANDCQGSVQPDVMVSREQLAKLLTIPEGDKRVKTQEILKTPYCKLPSLEVRAGATAVREAYPLEFDPQTWLIVLYEGDQYAGYRFDLR
jgi:hypothetical protein